MPQAITEMFGNFIYSPELSYNELLVLEGTLKDEISEVLYDNEAEHISYDVSSDSIRIQCSFAQYNEHFFHKICDQILPFLKFNVEGKILFLHRDISTIHIYTIFNGDWQEASIFVPHVSEFEEILNREDV